jgi:hypothetical protein
MKARARALTQVGVALVAATALAIGPALVASAATATIAAPTIAQEQSQWCWAAASKSVIKYYKGTNPSQCTVVNWGKGSSTCANQPGEFGAHVGNALYYGGLSDIGWVYGQVSYQSLKNEIIVNRPAMIRWGWNSTGGQTGHMVLVRGYNDTNSQVYLMNPDGGVVSWQTISWLQSGGGHTWTHTRTGMLK